MTVGFTSDIMPATPPDQSLIDSAEYYRSLGMSQYEAYDLAIKYRALPVVQPVETFFRLSGTGDSGTGDIRISSIGERRIYQ